MKKIVVKENEMRQMIEDSLNDAYNNNQEFWVNFNGHKPEYVTIKQLANKMYDILSTDVIPVRTEKGQATLKISPSMELSVGLFQKLFYKSLVMLFNGIREKGEIIENDTLDKNRETDCGFINLYDIGI